jgi:hypothetical protein
MVSFIYTEKSAGQRPNTLVQTVDFGYILYEHTPSGLSISSAARMDAAIDKSLNTAYSGSSTANK